MNRLHLLAVIGALAVIACGGPGEPRDAAPTPPPATLGNPAAEGFNEAGSDAVAMEMADRVMESMGGRAAWDSTRYLAWRFFYPPPDGRTHIWDKETGQVRYEHGDQLTLVNIHTREGSSWVAGEPIEDPEKLAKALQQGYEAWVNDSYWLLMPYKLKDSGVTLTYISEGETEDGQAADIVQMTFADVGVTPQNKYHVWISKDRSMVEQWAYYPNATDEEPQFVTPWTDWSRHGEIQLSGNRGQFALTEIAVLTSIPESAFHAPEPVDWSAVTIIQ
ncbi:MAG: hypothetical protein VYE73_12515 [Acidobacteriota bacterium]|nr:hypothetical protein [Acidobacteriota bacterium]